MYKLLLFFLLFPTACLGKVTNENILIDTYDLLEINVVYNEYGGIRFCQLIMWDWSRINRKYQIAHYVMSEDAFEKTEEGEKKWNDKMREIEKRYSNLKQRETFRSYYTYKGEFVGGKLYPKKNHINNLYVVDFVDSSGIRRKLQSPVFRETHTQYDPEMDDRWQWNNGFKKDRRGWKKQQPKNYFQTNNIDQ